MAIYRIILILAAPFVAVFLLFRLMRGRETIAGILERTGLRPRTHPSGPHIWVHGASLGELTAARPLIDDLLKKLTTVRIVATVNTYTARDMVAAWGNPRVSVQMAPLDFGWTTRKFINKWQPLAAIALENEIWPTRILSCWRSDIPVFVVGARMSARSAGTWGRFPNLARQVMAAISYLAPLDGLNGSRFQELGLANDRLGTPINLKSAVKLPPADRTEIEQFRNIFVREKTYLAASTHDGEETDIIRAFAKAYEKNKDLKLIIAPRHPHRGDVVARIISDTGLRFSLRSEVALPNQDDTVLLADTVGEMPLWYSLASVTIVGGTFAPKGGHTPFEPVQFGSIVAHGPNVENHAEAFKKLGEANAAICIGNVSDLQNIFTKSGTSTHLQTMADRATAALNDLRRGQTDTSEILEKLSDLIDLKK